MNPGNEMVKAGEVIRQEFDARQVERSAETQSAAVAAREQAAIQARYVVAMRNPRDTENFRVALLKECRRPGFAEIAEYNRPVGKKRDPATGEWHEQYAIGPSVHLIRTAVSLYWNMMVDSATMYESADTRIIHAYTLDLQTNVSQARTIVVSKVIEKRGQKKGKEIGPPESRDVVGERVNTYGEKVYMVIATDDEVRVKESRLIAIAQRENGRAILPRDIIDEARMIARATVAKQDAADPDAALRKLVDAFAELNVKPADLAEFLGHQLDKIVPAELKDLRGVFVSLRDGETTWTEVMSVRDPVTGSKEAQQEVLQNKFKELGLDSKGKPMQKTEVASPPVEPTTHHHAKDSNGESGGPSTTASEEPSTPKEAPIVEESGKASDGPSPDLDAMRLDQMQSLSAYEEKFKVARKPARFWDILMTTLGTSDLAKAPWEQSFFMAAVRALEEELKKTAAPRADGPRKLNFGEKP